MSLILQITNHDAETGNQIGHPHWYGPMNKVESLHAFTAGIDKAYQKETKDAPFKLTVPQYAAIELQPAEVKEAIKFILNPEGL